VRLGSIAAAVSALLTTAVPAHAAEQVLYVGDSLGVGTTPGLARELGSEVRVHGDSRIGRPSGEALTVLRQSLTPADHIVVFDIGTNDDPAQPGRLAADLSAARRLAGDRCMVVATLNRPPLNGVPVDGLNHALLAFADGAPPVQLVDWNAIVASEPSLLGPDRIHPTPEGYATRAQLFAEAVASCSSSPPAGAGAGAGAGPAPQPRQPAPARPKRDRKSRRPAKVPGIESSGISFTEPVSFRGPGARLSGELLLPNTKAPYPAVVMLHGAGRATRTSYGAQAEFFAAHGIATLVYDKRRDGVTLANLAADARAAVALLHARSDIRKDGIALWGFGQGATVAPLAAAGFGKVAALVAVAPAVMGAAVDRDWAVRHALGGSGAAAVHTWLALRARTDADLRFHAVPVWRRVMQPVLAIWGTRDRFSPIRANAAALRDALTAGPNRDRTFRWFDATHAGAAAYRNGRPVFAPGFLEDTTRWLTSRLGATKPTPAVRTPLPPANGGPQPVGVTNASFAAAPVPQAIWLVMPALMLLAWSFAARRRAAAAAASASSVGAARLVTAMTIADGAALVAIGAGVADVLASDGRDVAHVAGVPALFALAFGLVALGTALTVWLARRRAWLPVAASAVWLALALFWLL
jgi:dienelactone hydrolase/lysophospholipase L1-like esterase